MSSDYDYTSQKINDCDNDYDYVIWQKVTVTMTMTIIIVMTIAIVMTIVIV